MAQIFDHCFSYLGVALHKLSRHIVLDLLGIFLLCGGVALAQGKAADDDLVAVRQAFLARYPEISRAEVAATPFPGLYELRVGDDLLYADAQVNFLLQGALIDTQSRTDLTEKRQQALNHVAFDALPLELAIKQVRGAGTHQIAIFEDPNCRYCKELHQTLAQMDDVTIYTFLFPILSEDSGQKARNIWCAADRAQVWQDWMLRAQTPPEASCATPIDTLLALGQKLRIRGTPAIFFTDGSRVSGALPPDALRARLAQVTSKG